MRKSFKGILWAALLVVVATGCKDPVSGVVKHATNPETVPTMKTTDVQTIISDNGRTRYRITTPLWAMYEEAKEPHWIFPQGVVAEEMDSTYKIITTIKCDSAYYDERKQLWELNGNVNIIATGGQDRISTDKLFWDQMTHRFYGEAFIHVEKGGRVIEGYGYESNEQFSTYTLRKVEAIFPIDESRMPHAGSR